jgi:hypothetical protein
MSRSILVICLVHEVDDDADCVTDLIKNVASAEENARSFPVNSRIDLRRLAEHILSFVRFALLFERVGPKLVF